MHTNQTTEFRSGLEGVVAAQTRLSHVDGQHGRLIVGGYAIEELAPHATFEEVVYLLWHDRLPAADELAAWRQELAAWRALPPAAIDLLRAAAKADMPPMDALRMAAGTLDLELPAGRAAMSSWERCSSHACPTVVAAYWRLRQGLEPLPPTAAWAMRPTTCTCSRAHGQATRRTRPGDLPQHRGRPRPERLHLCGTGASSPPAPTWSPPSRARSAR